MAANRSLYNILNVSSDAEPVVIEAAYRALMKKYHPDQGAGGQGTGGQSGGAAEINAAFATLREPDRRAEYDRREWSRQQEMMLAKYHPPVAIVHRRTGLFGWTGWAVAGILSAVMLIAAGSSSNGAGMPAGGVRTAAAELVAPAVALHTQNADDVLLSPAGIAQIEAEARAVEVQAAMTVSRIEAESGTSAMLRRVEARSHAARPTGTSAKPRRPRQPTQRARTSDEREFLERQGYIY